MKTYTVIILRFLLVFVLSGITSYSQVKLISESIETNKYILNISFEKASYSILNINGMKRIHFDNFLDESEPGSLILPSKEIFIAIPENSTPKLKVSVSRSNTISANPEINPFVYSLDDSTVIYRSAEPNYDFKLKPLYKIKGYLWINNNYCIHLKINQYQYDYNSSSIIELTDIEIELGFDQQLTSSNTVNKNFTKYSPIINPEFASRYQSKPKFLIPNTDEWIDYSKTYIKIGTAADAIYRINYNDLNDLGVNVSQINPKTFSLIKKGYSVAIYVEGEEDGSFDTNDFIEFVGIRNMGEHHRETSVYGQPYKEYLGRYTDTTIFWLTWGGEFGERVQVSDGDEGLVISDTLKYYNEIIHIETNNWFDFSMDNLVRRENPYWFENKTWHEGNLGVGVRNISFNVSDIFPDKPIKFFVKLQDYATDISTNSHLLALSLNSNPTLYDSGYINSYEQKVLSGETTSNELSSGTNTLKIHSFPTNANLNLCIRDWYEIEYPRYLNSIEDSLNFSFPYLNSDSTYGVLLNNINTTNVKVWKYGSSFKKYELTMQNNSVFFKDTINSTNKFVFFDVQKIIQPKLYYVKQFVNLRDSTNVADYLSITNKEFLSNVQSYNQFIQNNYEVNSKVIDIDDIYDEFAYGYFNPESIKDFLKVTHSYWGSPYPKFVFLIGEANYDYHANKTIFQNTPPITNIVPSFGAPVSDNWFVFWDTTSAYIAQMDIGRLPVKSIEEFGHYFQKHQDYLSGEYDEWNKKYLFFSGGNFQDSVQINIMRNTNNLIIDNYVIPPPVGGLAHHFYKTVNPITNFGPFSPEEINNAITQGSVFISYLGHSGTQTWDNSITDPTQLDNSAGRSPMISDFGCSTVRFAEPDIVSFSELSVNGLTGQSIAYLGNSSLGFTSTSYTFPEIFYSTILQDSVYNIGDAHRFAKIKLQEQFGSTGSFQLFVLTNTLIGDPIINLPIPLKPNFRIQSDNIELTDNLPTDATDSLAVRIIYNNLGVVESDSVNIKIIDLFNNQMIYNKSVIRMIPSLVDTILVYLPIKDNPGEHILSVNIDPDDLIDEIYDNDNATEYNFNVASSSVRSLLYYIDENRVNDNLVLLNPSANAINDIIEVDFGKNPDFANPHRFTYAQDTFYTKIEIDTTFEQRTWIRYKLASSQEFGTAHSFIFDTLLGYIINDSISFANTGSERIDYNGNEWKLGIDSIKFELISAGFNDGNTAVISKNSQNFIPQSELRGHHLVTFNDSTFEFIEYRLFDLFAADTIPQTYIDYLDSLSNSVLVLFAVSDEGSFRLTSELKNKIKEFGSIYIDSLSWRGSCAFIGYKEAIPGNLPEVYSRQFEGRVTIDTSVVVINNTGNLLTTKIGPATKWEGFNTIFSEPQNSSMKFNPIGFKTNGIVDTLSFLVVNNGTADLSSIDADVYPNITILAEFNAASDGTSPTLSQISVDYISTPELGTNYQVVSSTADTVTIGEDVGLSFYVYNVGETTADSFKVIVDVINDDNSRQTIFNQSLDSLRAGERQYFEVSHNTSAGSGSKTFLINIDSDKQVTELFEDNNFYTIPFFIKPDTTTPTLNITFDGYDILDGDYISDKPVIKTELTDLSLLPINDPASMEIYLNEELIPPDSSILTYQFSETNPKVTVEFTPELADGEYFLRVLGKDASGNLADSSGVERYFLVSNEAKILYVYNYPNPFKEATNFTFKLTQIPDEIKIKIFTIAGRLVKEMKLTPSQLNFDFNKIYWNGKDGDGDQLANGVYLYKIIMTAGDKTEAVTQKLAIVR